MASTGHEMMRLQRILKRALRPLCSQPDARSIGKPETPPFGLFGGNFQPLPSPDLLDPLIVHDPPSGRTQEFCDLAVAVTTILAGKRDDVGRELCLIISPLRNTPLRRTMLAEHAADPPLGQVKPGSDVIDAGPATGGA
jgi:hypothetical protein